MKLKNFLTVPTLLLFLSAVLSALPFTFSFLFPLSWVAFVPLFYVIIKNSINKLKSAFGLGFLFGFFYHICIYYWFIWFYPLEYADLNSAASVAVVILAWFGISIVHGALWCIPFVFCRFAQKINRNPAFLSAVAIIGIMTAQKLTGVGELSFPWVRISLGQYTATPLIQSASLFGIDGVDMLILTVNALIAICVTTQHKKRIFVAAAALVIFCANLGFGLIRINAPQNKNEFTVMTVQGSISQNEKWSQDGDKICYDAYSTLTKENVTNDIDLVIWPESAVPKEYKSQKSLKQYSKLSKEIDTPLLAGVLLKSDNIGTNNTLLIDQSGVKASYAKRQLVPFGEYMPYQKILSKLFPVLTELNIIEVDYVSGDSTAIMDTSNGKIGNIICFESIYPELTRQSASDGAQLMIEVTNDSWLEDSPAMKQHLAHGVFRSVENNRYLVRSANSGISATIDSRGKVIKTLDANRQGVITDTVYFCDEQTLYTKTGDIIFPTSTILLSIWFLVLIFKKIYNKKEKA